MPIERKFHTNHGLHLNKQGKDWIASNLVKEIGNLHLQDKSTPPIMLPWRDINENASQLALENQVSPVTSHDVQECPSPGYKNGDSQKFRGNAVSCNGDNPQEEEAIRRSNRVKISPANKYHNFLCQTNSINQTV